jgi:hypothetical protein
MWNYPTVSAMTDWFLKQFEDGANLVMQEIQHLTQLP